MVKFCGHKDSLWKPKDIEKSAKEIKYYLKLASKIEAQNPKEYSRNYNAQKPIVVRVDEKVL